MKNAYRVVIIGLLAFGLLVFSSPSWAQTRPPIVEQMAKTYGIDSWGQIEGIRYTFNIDLPALKLTLAHAWEWEPKTGKVTFEGKDKDGKPVKVTYLRSELNSQPANVKDEVNPFFLNDQYFLIFSFNVIWDKSAEVQDKGKKKQPLGKVTGDQIVVKYSGDV